MIEVIRAGLFTTVQDLGRTGSRHIGVGRAGALDTIAMRVANRLVANPDTAAGLEITIGQPVELRFTCSTRIALSGAHTEVFLDGVPVHVWWSVPVTAGQVLTVGTTSHGMRLYLAVTGGLDVAPLLNSRSTDVKGQFGGLQGRALLDGDILPIILPKAAIELAQRPSIGIYDGDSASRTDGQKRAPALALNAPAFGVKPPIWCDFAQIRPHLPPLRDSPKLSQAPTCVRVIRGPEYASYRSRAHEALWHAQWIVTPQSNRMGYRLKGPALEARNRTELLSHAVLPGTIQVPPDGQPIVLMGDAQTAGGYPKIGVVITADLWRLAQVRLNAPIRFVECAHADAKTALQEVEAYFRQLDLAVRLNAERHQT